MSEQLTKNFDLALKIATTIALISVALLGTKFVTKEEFIQSNARIEKIEAVLIRMEQNAITDTRHDALLADHELRIRKLEQK